MEFIGEIFDGLASRLTHICSGHVAHFRESFEKMLERASKTHRDGAGAEKQRLQREVLQRVGEFRHMIEHMRKNQQYRESVEDEASQQKALLPEHRDGNIEADDESDVIPDEMEGLDMEHWFTTKRSIKLENTI
jgi:hypothetical protein